MNRSAIINRNPKFKSHFRITSSKLLDELKVKRESTRLLKEDLKSLLRCTSLQMTKMWICYQQI